MSGRPVLLVTPLVPPDRVPSLHALHERVVYEQLKEYVGLLYDQALLLEGDHPRDPVAFAKAIALILDDPMLAAGMSSAAATKASRYTWSFAAARLRRLYSDLTSRQLVLGE